MENTRSWNDKKAMCCNHLCLRFYLSKGNREAAILGNRGFWVISPLPSEEVGVKSAFIFANSVHNAAAALCDAEGTVSDMSAVECSVFL